MNITPHPRQGIRRDRHRRRARQAHRRGVRHDQDRLPRPRLPCCSRASSSPTPRTWRSASASGNWSSAPLPLSNQERHRDGRLGEVFDIDSQRMRTNVGNEAWHTDSTYKPISSKCAMLSAVVVPETDGETELADLRARLRGPRPGHPGAHPGLERAFTPPSIRRPTTWADFPPQGPGRARRLPRRGVPAPPGQGAPRDGRAEPVRRAARLRHPGSRSCREQAADPVPRGLRGVRPRPRLHPPVAAGRHPALGQPRHRPPGATLRLRGAPACSSARASPASRRASLPTTRRIPRPRPAARR